MNLLNTYAALIDLFPHEPIYQIVEWISILSFSLALLVYLGYRVRLLMLNTPKEKHDFMQNKEAKVLKLSNVFAAVGIAALINLWLRGASSPPVLHVSLLLTISLIIGFIHVYSAFMLVNVYYARALTKKLKLLRYQPRINPKTGNTMKLLTEEEEDPYLDEGMKAEEEIFSVDYDVWVDEVSGDVTIEKYVGSLRVKECANCHFQTLKLKKEECIKAEDVGETPAEGIEYVKQYYRCVYCKSECEEVLSMRIADADSILETTAAFQKKISHIRISISAEDEATEQVYDFQNISQAKKFLSAYQTQHLQGNKKSEEETPKKDETS